MARLLITNARLIDGTGAPAVEGELLVEDGVIAEVGGASLSPDEVLDARGMTVVPGFIDMHSHSDFSLPVDPLAHAKVLQGVTTEVAGNCGLGITPATPAVERMYAHAAPLIFGEAATACSPSLHHYRTRLHDDVGGISANVAMLVPHGNVRCAALGMAERDAGEAEMRQMREMVAAEMEAGAFGLSSGLVYPPGAFAGTDELIELCKVVQPYGGIYATHMRDEGKKLVESVREALTIGRMAGVPVQISHHKAAGKLNWGKVEITLGLLDQAREAGLDVHSDVYPYAAGSTVLAAMTLPTWALEGTNEEVMSRLREPTQRARIIADAKQRMLDFIELEGILGWIPKRLILPFVLAKMSELVVICSAKNDHGLEGKTLRDIVRARRTDLFNTILDLLLEQDGAVLAIAHVMHEDDVRSVMRHRATMVGSDGFPLQHGKPHPRTWGTFPRVLARYVRDEGLLGLEEAIHRMTGMTAQKLGMRDRGVLRPGAAADLVVVDPDAVADRATYDDPAQPPVGIPHVLVAGTWTVRDGEHTGARAGRVLSRA